MRIPAYKATLLNLLIATVLVATGLASANAASINVAMTAQRALVAMPDSNSVPMWQFCKPGACGAEWAPGPTITAVAGDTLTINLTNNLKVPTSIVVLGQLGGGLGQGTRMASPAHNAQAFTTFPANKGVNPGMAFTPPTQADRIKSFGTEVASGATTSLTWQNLKPGTYIYETGTLPSLQVPMGLYGLLLVTQQAPVAADAINKTPFAPGLAYPAVAYNSDVPLLFSEIDPVQNHQVDIAEQAGTNMAANLRFNDPSCGLSCYPAAVNYTPTYFLINGKAFDQSNPNASFNAVGDAYDVSGKMLLRLANAGLRTHVPSIVGLSMSLVAEDGNLSPGNPKLQTEALLTAGKTLDVLIDPPSATGKYTANTFAMFDRQGSLTNANLPFGGMLGYLMISGSTSPAKVPAATNALAIDDAFSVQLNTLMNGNVRLNDIAVRTVRLVGAGPINGTLLLHTDGSFIYTPKLGFSGTDSFTYNGNGGTTNTATVNLSVGSPNGPPVANADTFSSNVAGLFKSSSPGVLANDKDPGNLKLTVDMTSVLKGSCGTVSINTDGSFTATGRATDSKSCTFTYGIKNSQGAKSNVTTVTVHFAEGSDMTLKVIDAKSGTAITDYRWTIQEDLTFKPATTRTPSLATRTLGTSFHRAHNTVVATGCTGPVSCGSGQTIRGVAVPSSPSSSVGDVALDESKHYYVSVLPGDAQNPVINGGGGPVNIVDNNGVVTGKRPFDIDKDCGTINDPLDPCGHTMGGTEVGLEQLAATIKLQRTPLVPAQLSIYIYNDNAPTNGQNDLNEEGLGDFGIILVDPAGRSGDTAGQQTYDSFNMPLTNSLLGSPGCPNDRNKGASATTGNNLIGVIYTCPNAPNPLPPGKKAADYALAGHALVQNITPARYDVLAHPDAARISKGEVWWQTETLEGTAAQDAFTGINEARYFQEFGPPGFHTTIGFVNPNTLNGLKGSGGQTITGKVTNQHMSRPSNTALQDAGSYDLLNSTTCRVALNPATDGPTLYATECDVDGNFSIAHVPNGVYQVAIWDVWLDQIIQTVAVNVNNAPVAMGNIPVFTWFTQHDQNQLLDDGSGNLTGIPSELMTVRYRNGSISNQTLTDVNGNGILVELFPLFNWYVSESDNTRFKQKSVRIAVDGGGVVDTTGPNAGLINSKYATGESSLRTELPGANSYGIQGYISQRNKIDWIKEAYAPGENGGIRGTVVYSSTRAYDDQRYNVQTIWEPLVPRVKVNLYRKTKQANGTETMQLVDTTLTTSFDDWVNTVYGADGKKYILGPDQVLRDPATGLAATSEGAYPAGKQVNISCPGQLPAATGNPPYDMKTVDPFTKYTLQGDVTRCYDGFHNWNQVQAAPYDGKYQFPSEQYIKANSTKIPTGGTLVTLPAGDYVVEVEMPDGYEITKEEDKNILIGDAFIAPVTQQFGSLGSIFILPDQATLTNGNPNNPNTGDKGFQSNPTTNLGVSASKIGMPECVGALHRVPDYLSIYPQAQQVAPFAGMDRPLCDKKLVKLGDKTQAVATFFIFTGSPVAANATGIILDDASAEFNAASPDFGEKASVPFVPVSTKDFTGNEVSRVYSDQWGAYNLMLPSSWLVNPPTPSGYGPNMLVNCINDPGPILDRNGKLITDPAYNPAYSNFCYTNPFMPGQATYLDTPVLPIAAFAAGNNPADCAYPDATPAILRVDTQDGFGPYVSAVGQTITIKALGNLTVQNPAYAGPFATSGPSSRRTITRHYGFGRAVGKVTVNGVPLTGVNWSDTEISGTIATGTTTGELVISTADGKSSTDTVTVTVGGAAPKRVIGANGDKIQAAIDAAIPGDLILVDAGTYNELVIMWKPVRLQGVGAPSVIINAAKYPTSKLANWRPRINDLFAIDINTGNQTGPSQVDPLPGQEIIGGVVLLEPSVLGTEEGAGITVLAKDRQNLTLPNQKCTAAAGKGWDSDFLCADSRIDGISVTGGDAGGGIYVNGWAHNLEIANNRVYGNAGALNGGVRIGVPYLDIVGYSGQSQNADGTLTGSPVLSGGAIAGMGFDQNVKIHHNAITKNGSIEGTTGQGGAGGGVSICTGTDGYSVDHNWICGNYSQADGGGIGHLGFSQGGKITNNQILFNQSFQQTVSTHGGGIFVGGEPALALQNLTLGTGSLTIDANVIRGNFAEAGHGGGVRLQQVNGADVENFHTDCGDVGSNCLGRWNKVTMTNNIIDNNVAGWAGGGISLADTLISVIENNTIASNDSVGIAGPLLAGGTLPSQNNQAGTGKPNPAGVASEPNGADLVAVLPNGNLLNTAQMAISSPDLVNNIVWKNRSFFFKNVAGNASLCSSNTLSDASGITCQQLPDQSRTGQCVGSPAYWDLGVLGDFNAVTPGAMPAITLTATQAPTQAGNVVKIVVPEVSLAVNSLVTISGFVGSNANFYNGVQALLGVATTGGFTTFTYRPTNDVVVIAAFNALDKANVTVTVAARQGPVLSPTSSVITAGYAGSGNANTNPNLADIYCNGSRITPEFAGVINPPSPKNLQVAATVDEGSNYVSLRYGPLTLAKPSNGNGNGIAFGDYHLASTATFANSSALDHGVTGISTHDVDNQFRPQGVTTPAKWDIGAHELKSPALIAAASPSTLSLGNQSINTSATQVITLGGRGAQGSVTFVSASFGSIGILGLDFGNQTGNVPSIVTLSNSGTAPLVINSASVTNVLGAAFSMPAGAANDTCSGKTIAVGATCTVTIQFNGPLGNSLRTAVLSITDNGTGSPQTLAVRGN